ncbi:MAG: hypothetical protein ACLTCI_06750 [[Clostridium] nexile]
MKKEADNWQFWELSDCWQFKGSIETKAAKQLAPSSVKAPTLTITEILPDSSNVESRCI